MQEIELPDGTVLEFPDGMSDDEIRSAVQQYQGETEQPQQQEQSYGAGLLDAATQGAVAGFGDELTAAEAALLGRTPQGDWFNYSQPMGERYNQALEAERGQQQQFRQQNPVASTGAEIAGGVATAMTPVGAIGTAANAPMSAANLARAGAAGAGWGAAYGFGEGEGGVENRLANVPINAGIGMAGGVAGNALQAGAGRLGRLLTSDDTLRAQQMGVSPEAYRMMRSSAQAADADIPGGARQFIAQGGPDAMVGDVMPGPLDYAANVGAGAPIARRNLGARVDRATRQTDQALDTMFGQPQGVRQTAGEIASSTQPQRAATYDLAYSRPINYADETGQRIEGILQRVPQRTLKEAIDEANEEMASRGLRNQQILADIADDGTVSFREMPNVQQLDEIKKALQTQARENIDQFGRRTARGNRSDRLARELRDALGDAVPEYNAATAAGADKIAQDQALEIGQQLLSPRLTVEQAQEAIEGMGASEKTRTAQGVRAYIDNLLGNVKQTRSDPNIDQREAWKAISDMLTRNNRAKIEALYPPAEADFLFNELEQAARAFGVRAGAAGNSATAGRQAFGQQVQEAAQRGRIPERSPRSILDETLSIPSRAFNYATGRTPAATAQRTDAYTRELAELLTGLRGDEALRAFEQLVSTARPSAGAVPSGRLSQYLARGTRLAAPPAAAPLIQP